MKSIRALALGVVLAVSSIFLVLADAPASAQVLSYQLLTNAAVSGPVVAPLGADYLLNVAGTFGGATLTLQESFNGQTTTLQTLTAAPSSPPCLAIPNGATLQMVVTGGSPSGLYANLGGVGSGGCAGTSSETAIPAGLNNIGRVGFAADIAGTGIVTRPANTTTYSANTAWANATSGATYGTFAGVCAANGGNVYVTDAGFLDAANQATKLQGILYLFSAAPTVPISDNATFNVASADWPNLKRVSIPFAFGNVVNQTSGSGGAQVVDVPVGAQLSCGAGSTSIEYMIEVTNPYVPLSAEQLTPSLHVFATN